MHNEPKLGQRGRCVSYIDARNKGTGTPFRFASFWERISETALQRFPSQKYPWLYFYEKFEVWH
jgi:hypothetical protein